MRLIRLSAAFVAFVLSASIVAAQSTPSNADICRADVDGSTVVDLPDVNAVNAAFRSRRGQPKFNAAVDFDNDGSITLADRTFVTTKMGLRCVTTPANRAPVFTSTPVTAATAGVAYTYQLTATDADGDAIGFTVKAGPPGLAVAGALVSWAQPVVGTHSVTLEASDGKGGIATQAYQLVVSAPQPPQVSLVAPATGLKTRTALQTVSGTVSDPSVAAGVLRVNGVDQPLQVTGGQFSKAITLGEGVNRLVASAANAGGTGSSAEVLVTVDSLGPTLDARMPVGVAAGARVELLADAFDESGVSGVSMQVNGAPGGSLTRIPYVFSVNVPPTMADGALVPLSFTATDTLGNTRTILRALTVRTSADDTPPSVLLSMPSTATPGERVPVTVSAQDDRAVVELSLLQGPATLRQVMEPPFAVQQAFTVPATATPGQVVELTGRARDAAGNTGSASAGITVISPLSDQSGLHLTVNPVVTPTFLPSQVISGVVSTVETIAQHRPRSFIGSLTVTEGQQGQRLEVGVVGENSSFAAGASQALFGAGITVNAVTVQSPTQLTVDITIAPNATIGPRLVAVQTGSEEALLLNAFNVRSGMGAISGRLHDTQGQALAGVEVCVPGSALCAVTDATGAFSLAGAPSTSTRVSITVPGLNQQVSVPLRLAVGGSVQLGDIPIDLSDIPPPPPPPGGPQPPPAIARLLGLGLGDAAVGPSLAKGRRLVTEAFVAAGGSEAGVLDEAGRQVNPEVSGTGLITLTPDGVRVLAHRMERGETMALGDLLFAWSFGFIWSAQPPALTDWLEVMQAKVDAAWANPSDPQSVLPILVFNRDRILTATPPQLAPDMRLGPVQVALLTASFVGALLPDAAGGPLAGLSSPVAHQLAALTEVGRGWAAVPDRRAWERSRPLSDTPTLLHRYMARHAAQAGNQRRLTGFWRNAFAAKNTFVTQTLNNAFQAELQLVFALALPAMAPGSLLTTAANAGVASAFIGPISNFVQGAFGAVNAALKVPEAPRNVATEVNVGADGASQVHVQFSLSSSHKQPAANTTDVAWAYSLYRFRASDGARELVDHTVITNESTVPVRTVGGLLTERSVTDISPDEFRAQVVLTLTDRDPLPLVEENGRLVRANVATWFYAVTATKFERLTGGVRPDQLQNAVPWWNYPLGGRLDPGGLMALHTKSKHQFVSDYSEPKVVTVNASGVDIRSDGLEIDPNTGLAYYSDTRKRQIFRVDLGLGGLRQLFTVPNFKNAQNGLAIDGLGSLYSNNEASNAEFGGRLFRFQQPSGVRDHVGNVNYYSFLLQSANPASAAALAMGPGSQPGVSAEDLFLIDDLAQQVKRVPVRATFDPTRRNGQPWANLPFQARWVDFEFNTPSPGSADRPDGILLVDGLPASTLTLDVVVDSFVALGDSLRARLRIGNPGAEEVRNLRYILTFSGEGQLNQVTAPPAPITLGPGGSREYEVELRGAGSGAVTLRALAEGIDSSDVTVSSPPVERPVTVQPPLAITITTPRESAPGALFEVTVEAHNRSTTSRLVDVVPTVTPFDPILGPTDVLGQVAQVSGPVPATLALDPGARGTFTFQFRGVRAGRAGVEARATARTADTLAAMSAGPEKGGVNITPLSVDLIVPPSIKKDAVANASVVLHNLSNVDVVVTPVLERFGINAANVVEPTAFETLLNNAFAALGITLDIVGPSPFGTAVSVPANGSLTLPFNLKGARRGLMQLEAFGRVTVDGVPVTTNRDVERISVGPTITGVVSDVGFSAFNTAFDENLMNSRFGTLSGLGGLTVVAVDGQGGRVEAVTDQTGRYVLVLDHGGPFTLTVLEPVSNIGATRRGVVVPLGEDLRTIDFGLPATLINQAKRVARELSVLRMKVDHEKVTLDDADSNVVVSYSGVVPAFQRYLDRFQQGLATPLFVDPHHHTAAQELSEWDALVRMTTLLTFTKRRFDDAASSAGIFVKDVVDLVVAKVGVDKLGKVFDDAVQNRLFRTPENSSLEAEFKQMKEDRDKASANAEMIQKSIEMINKTSCTLFQGLLEDAYLLGFYNASNKQHDDLVAGCETVTKFAEVVIKRLIDLFRLTLSNGPVEVVQNALKAQGAQVGMDVLMNLYVNEVTQPQLIGAQHRAERTLELRGETLKVVDTLRLLDDQARSEVVRLQSRIAGAGEVDSGLIGFLDSAAQTVDRTFLKKLKEGTGAIGKIIQILTSIDRMKLFSEVPAMGPGKVCRAANQVFRADAGLLDEPPAASLFCVADLPADR